MTRDRSLLGHREWMPAAFDILGIAFGIMLVANAIWELRPQFMESYVIVRLYALLTGFILASTSWTAYKYHREGSQAGE